MNERQALSFAVEHLDGTIGELRIESPALVICGYTGRDTGDVQRHIDELAEIGVQPPDEVPSFYFLPNWLLFSSGYEVEVLGNESTGEVEPVLIRDEAGALYVTVGSDQTDRQLESSSVVLSKAICPKVVGDRVWPYADVAEGWDRLRIESFCGQNEQRYQVGELAALRHPRELLGAVEERLDMGGRPLVLFLGTVPVAGGSFRAADRFTAVITDPASGRSIRCVYGVRPVGAVGAIHFSEGGGEA